MPVVSAKDAGYQDLSLYPGLTFLSVGLLRAVCRGCVRQRQTLISPEKEKEL
ncbi:hypothetical protein LX36DRAFT_652776 [Colletotrichum falcatum]|nr:hypothetical protein LX36DRAFT_652776 [Colletotrichum falcatum]